MNVFSLTVKTVDFVVCRTHCSAKESEKEVIMQMIVFFFARLLAPPTLCLKRPEGLSVVFATQENLFILMTLFWNFPPNDGFAWDGVFSKGVHIRLNKSWESGRARWWIEIEKKRET
jgi:hypothetical protein